MSAGKVIGELFTEVLRLGDLTLSAVNENAFAQYVIHDPKVFNQALSELGRDGQELLAWWLRAKETDPSGTVRRLAHGDMHSRNILVTAPTGRPYVIDFGATGIHHFPRDLAKLEREVWLRLFRPTEPDRVAACEELAAAVDAAPRVDSEVLKALEVLRQLRSLAARFVSAETSAEYEYDVAALAQFMFAAANRHERDSVRRAALVRALTYRGRVEARHPRLRLRPDDARGCPPGTALLGWRTPSSGWISCRGADGADRLPTGWRRSGPATGARLPVIRICGRPVAPT